MTINIPFINIPITMVSAIFFLIFVFMFFIALISDIKNKKKIMYLATQLVNSGYFEFYYGKFIIAINAKQNFSTKIIFHRDCKTIIGKFSPYGDEKFIVSTNDAYLAQCKLKSVEIDGNNKEALKNIFKIRPNNLKNTDHQNIFYLIEATLQFCFFSRIVNSQKYLRIEFKINIDKIDVSNINDFISKFFVLNNFIEEFKSDGVKSLSLTERC